jgi:hypothetical protein
MATIREQQRMRPVTPASMRSSSLPAAPALVLATPAGAAPSLDGDDLGGMLFAVRQRGDDGVVLP